MNIIVNVIFNDVTEVMTSHCSKNTSEFYDTHMGMSMLFSTTVSSVVFSVSNFSVLCVFVDKLVYFPDLPLISIPRYAKRF